MNNPIDYMSRPEEAAKQPEALALCQKIAEGWPVESERVFVFNACWSFWNFAHAWDDLIDETKAEGWPKERRDLIWKALYHFVDDLLLNPFIRQHASQVRSLMVNGIGKAMDGDEMQTSDDPAKKALAPAVRCSDVDILLGMAELAGGWKLMRELGPNRDYDPA